MIQATLLFDSSRTERGLGVRNIAPGQRSLVFRSKELSVALVMYVSNEKAGVIHGQVVREPSGAPLSGGTIRLDDGASIASDDYGQFASAFSPTAPCRVVHVEVGSAHVACTIPGSESHEER